MLSLSLSCVCFDQEMIMTHLWCFYTNKHDMKSFESFVLVSVKMPSASQSLASESHLCVVLCNLT